MHHVLLFLLLAASPGADQINADLLRAHVRFLSSDGLEGRGPATAGDHLAQTYIATQLEGLGVRPAVDGGYLQPVELIGVRGAPEALTAASPTGASLTLTYRDDVMLVAGRQAATSTLERAELVFVGYGIVAPEYQWDDYKGVDVKGKVVLVMNNDPEDDPNLFAGKARLSYGRWDTKYEQAARHGAAGCIIIHTTPSAGYPWQVVQTSWAGEQFDLPESTTTPRLEVKGWATEDASRRLVALSGRKLDELRARAQRRGFTSVPLGGVTVSTHFSNVVSRRSTANVVGLVPGSDPVLRNELIVVTAHHDHLGRKANASPGSDDIYNGAVDNAAGVAALLAVAKAVSSLPPLRRSVLFAAVAAEEQGLLGSQYLVAHQPVPGARMVADINIDGANIWGRTRDVSVIGFGKSNIDASLIALAKTQGRVVKPDALADRGFFYRSDQLNFARAGIPSAYFSSGQDFVGRPEGWGRQQREAWEATRYHQPSDELTADWEFSGAVEDAQLYLGLTMTLANAEAAPAWVPGDEFSKVRAR